MATINGLRLYPEEAVQNIATMIRRGTGTNNTYKISQMAAAISALSNTGGDASQFASYLQSGFGIKYSYSSTSKFTSLRPYLFYQAGSSLTAVSYPNVTSVGTYAFFSCSSLASVYLPNCLTVGSHAFQYCRALSSINLSKVTTGLGTDTFGGCSVLQSVNLNLCESIPARCFANLPALSSISLPNCLYVGESAFYSCSQLASISMLKVSFLDLYAFYSNKVLASVNLPACIEIGAFVFGSCVNLSSVSLPALKSLGYSAFRYCSSLTSINLPKVEILGHQGYQFTSCINLHTVDLGSALTSIPSCCFNSCYNLLSVYLRGSSICQLAYYTSVFKSTPISGYTTSTGGVLGSIFVPASLVSAYQAATNWVRFSSRITSI